MTHRSETKAETYGVLLPWWLLLAIAGGPCLWWFDKAQRRAWRLTQALCLQCGYDLRASPERCPECGSPVPAGHTLKVAP